MPKARAGLLRRLVLERIFGACYGVRNAADRVAAFESCRPPGTLKLMPLTSAATLTTVHIRSALLVREA